MKHIKQSANSQQFDLTNCVICLTVICLSWKSIISLTHPAAQLLDFWRGWIDRKWVWLWKGDSDLFQHMNYHDDKMYNTVVPPKILLHKKNKKGLKVFLWILCIYSLMSQQDKTHGHVWPHSTNRKFQFLFPLAVCVLGKNQND